LLDEKISALALKNESLNIRMPTGSWMVEGLPPNLIVGRHFASGDPIVTLVSTRQRFIDVIVDQRDMYLLTEGNKGRIRFAGVGPAIYDSVIDSISPMAKLEGIEQSFVVRMSIFAPEGLQVPPLGLSGEVLIFGKRIPLGLHFVHMVRKILRADLWL